MSDHVIDTETVDTDAGDYVVSWYVDEDAEQPYNEGLGFVFDGKPDRRLDVAKGEPAAEVLDILNSRLAGWHENGRAYYRYSSAGIARYLRMKFGVKGVREVDGDFYTSAPTTDLGSYIAGIAWAPSDVPAEYDGDTDYPSTYTDLGIAEYRAWADGDCFGYVITGPDGAELDDGALWGFYGFSETREYALSQARDAIDSDAADRVKNANVVGAGIVGII